MNLNETQLRAMRSTLSVESIVPPRQAVIALFALCDGDPVNAIASATWENGVDRGAVRWQLLALTGNSVVSVTANAHGPWQWRTSPGRSPDGAHLRARRFPMSQVRSVGVQDVVLRDDPTSTPTDVTGHFSWVLDIAQEHTIAVAPDGEAGTRERHARFFNDLMAAL